VLDRVPRHIQQSFRGRKKEPTQNVMVAMRFDLKFPYVLAGWEGSAHDATVLADAIERDDGFTIAQGNCTNKLLLIWFGINFGTSVTVDVPL
jgi:hypothetical protein